MIEKLNFREATKIRELVKMKPLRKYVALQQVTLNSNREILTEILIHQAI